MKQHSINNVCLYASQLAGCIGKNKYVPLKEALETVWKRVAPVSYKSAQARAAVVSQEARLAELRAQHAGVEHALTAAASYDGLEVSAVSTRLTESIPVNLPPADRELVAAEVKKSMFTAHGLKREHAVFQQVQHDLGLELVHDHTFHCVPMGTCRGVPWSLGGRIDGISKDRTTVVEIKNRVNRLFMVPPEYELVQIQAYMHLIPGVEQAILVESYRGQMNTITIKKDTDYWNAVVYPAMTQFVEQLLDVIDGDEATHAAFFSSKACDTVPHLRKI